MTSALKQYLDAMCSPRTLDTDLAGIGVSLRLLAMTTNVD